jgi:RHS repeat-associated protein
MISADELPKRRPHDNALPEQPRRFPPPAPSPTARRPAIATAFGQTTTYPYDSLDVMNERARSGDANNLRTIAFDEALAGTEPPGTLGYLRDALCSTLALADSSGGLPTTYTYAPFGETAVSGLPSSSPFQFTGRENDGTGLYYYRARYYDPIRSRFVSEDPIGMLGGFQLYAYTGGNPLRFTDPNGLCKIDVRFAQLGPGWYHAYVLTTDSNGSQNYYRGGPSAPGPSGGASGALGSASGGTTSGSLGGRNCGVSNSANSTSPGAGRGGPGADNGPWGSIATSSGPYLPFTIDYDPGKPPSASVLSNDASCGGYNSALAKALGDINKAQIPYNPLSTNSNAVAREIIERAGLSAPSPPVWAPGWSTRLPR